jgi:hypothetical protein
MGRRSAGNPRYRRDAEIGKTRRSAASAKPKREAGEAPTKARSSAGKGSGGKGGSVDWRTAVPDTPEYKRLRMVWLVMLIVAMVASIGGYFLRHQETLGSIALALAYTALFAAFGIDLLKIRPMRKEWVEARTGGGKKKESKAEGADAGTTEPSKEKESSDEGKA